MHYPFRTMRTSWQFFGILSLTICSSFQPMFLGNQAAADEYNPAFSRGLTHFARRDYDEAINDFNEAIGFDDRNPQFYFKRGQCFFNLNNNSLAIKDFDEAIKQSPDSSEFYLYRGTAYAKSGEDDQAVKDYVQAIHLDPKLFQAYKERNKNEEMPTGPKRQFGERGQLLLTESRKEIFLSPAGASATESTEDSKRFSKGVNARNKGAVEDYRIAMKMSAKNDAAYSNSGTAYNGIAKPEVQGPPQRDNLKSDQEKNGDNGLVRDILDTKIEKPAKSVKDLSAIIELEPTNDSAYYKRARAYQQLGQSERALRDFSQAITFNPLAKYYLARAYLYNKMSRPALAQADIDNARSVDATLPEHISFEKGDQK